MIYVFQDFYGFPDEWYHKMITILPISRQEKAKRYRNDIDYKACILTYLLLRLGLQREYQYYKQLTFNLNIYEKPYLVEYPHIYFNFSHCIKGVVCAIAEEEIGVDIQEVAPIDYFILNDVCSEHEIIQLCNSSNVPNTFSKIWTLKESFLKYKGIGLTNNIVNLDFSLYLSKHSFKAYNSCFDTFNFPHYNLSICSKMHVNKLILVSLHDMYFWSCKLKLI